MAKDTVVCFISCELRISLTGLFRQVIITLCLCFVLPQIGNMYHQSQPEDTTAPR